MKGIVGNRLAAPEGRHQVGIQHLAGLVGLDLEEGYAAPQPGHVHKRNWNTEGVLHSNQATVVGPTGHISKNVTMVSDLPISPLSARCWKS